MIGESLIYVYPWTKALHLISVISWMAGLLYLPRMFVYHAERAQIGSELSETFKIMEMKLYRFIMTPAMIAAWLFGLTLIATPGVIEWAAFWFYVKFACLLGMSWFHGWLGQRRKEFLADANTRKGRTFRIMNEVPTLLMLVIVVMVVVKPF
jgi:putative membrane protein